MKKNMFLLMIFIICSINIFAQTTPPIPCPPPCTDNDAGWSTPVFHSFEPDPIGCPDCWMGYWLTSFDYYCGDPSTEIRAFQIVGMTVSEGCNSCYITLNSMRLILSEAFLNTEYGYPDVNDCWYDIHFFSAACWTEVPVYNPVTNKTEYHFIPCANTECCSLIYKVCNIGTELTYTVQEVEQNQYICSTSPILCSSFCEFFNYDGSCEFHFPRISLGSEIAFKDKFITSAFVNRDNLELELSTNTNSKVNVKILTILGKPIFEKSYNLNNGKNKIEISTSSFIDGLYYFIIEQDNEIISNGRFIIIH